ncbi:hypothetical protein LC612_39365 [Nostoc sp. CHAB 5834]|nr:hypothetical protein [Nostoc sp. CHAB 5834]
MTAVEASTGAAAVAVVAWRCAPAQYEVIRDRAMLELASMLREFKASERDTVLDSANMKIQALSISSSSENCQQLVSLKTMAKQWGFGHLLVN